MPSVASRVGALMHKHEVQRNAQEDSFAHEQQMARAAEDRKRSDLAEKAKVQNATAPKHAGREPIRHISDQEHANTRAAVIQDLHHAQSQKRKAMRDRHTREIEAARKKVPTAGKHAAPYSPEEHHPISVIWHGLDSARQQAVRGVMEKYARQRDNADSDVLNMNKLTGADRYARSGGRVAMDMANRGSASQDCRRRVQGA